MTLDLAWKVTDDRRLAGVVLRDDAEVYVCSHNHASTELAEECAGRKRTDLSQQAQGDAEG